MSDSPKQRIAKISTQLQVRLPRDLYERYGFGAEAEVVATDTGIEFRPLKTESEKCADLLEQLIREGLEGEELIARFRASALEPGVAIEYSPQE